MPIIPKKNDEMFSIRCPTLSGIRGTKNKKNTRTQFTYLFIVPNTCDSVNKIGTEKI